MIGALLAGKYEQGMDILFRKKLDKINNVQIGLSAINEDLIVYATDYPDSIKGLIKTLSICDYVIYVPSVEINAIDAELALAIEFSEVKEGVMIIDEAIDIQKMERLLGNLKVSKLKRTNLSGVKELNFQPVERANGKNRYVSIDKYFLVRGIGSVLIGFVFGGTVNKNDKLFLLPSGKQVTIKSIQVMDEDRKEAFAGEHVGLALNNATEKDMEENYCLSDSKDIFDKFTADIEICKFYSRDINNLDLASAFYDKELNLKIETKNMRNVCSSNERIPLTDNLLLMDPSLGKGKNRVVGRLYNLKQI
ncbi:MAG: EF-Tu/IF-2/RF-3 family GTPase [Candidatus Acidifodinimicrobium sp.]